jgi:hypothetical protein
MMKSIAYGFLMLFLSPFLNAETLTVGVNDTVAKNLPEVTSKIKEALKSTGLDFKFLELPGERSFIELSRGKVDIDIYRQDSAVTGLSNVVKIAVPVDNKKAYLFTHPNKSGLCSSDNSELKSYSVGGIHGVRFYEDFVFPRFKSHTEVINFDQILHLIDLQRVDFGVWELGGIAQGEKRTGIKVHICAERPLKEFQFFSYIHIDKVTHLPLIEKAYLKFFSGQNK